MNKSIQKKQSNAKDNERINQCKRQWKEREIEDIGVYFMCLCYQLEPSTPCIDFLSFILWSSSSNSDLNNIRSDKTEGQTHRHRFTEKTEGQTHMHRFTDTKHFHFKYPTQDDEAFYCKCKWWNIYALLHEMLHCTHTQQRHNLHRNRRINRELKERIPER